MNKRTPEVGEYIAKAAPFVRLILAHLRDLVHGACPEIEESIKWRHPHFSHHGMLCGIAAFKAHCSFGFWKHPQIFGEQLAASDDAMGQFGRLTSLADLPDDAALIMLIQRAAAFNEARKSAGPKPKRTPRPPPLMPDDLASALRKNAAAGETFGKFSVTDRREYIEWLTEAKTEATRNRRLLQAIEWMAEGKSRNWKYARSQ